MKFVQLNNGDIINIQFVKRCWYENNKLFLNMVDDNILYCESKDDINKLEEAMLKFTVQ